MPVNFNLAPKMIGPPMQALAMLALKLSAGLPAKSDQTGGLAGRMADDGYDRTPGVPSISNRNVLYVIGLYGYNIPKSEWMGYRIEFLLNGQYFELRTGYQAPEIFGEDLPPAYTSYPPLSIAAIAQPTAVTKNIGRTDKTEIAARANPPPINPADATAYNIVPRNANGGMNTTASGTADSGYSVSPANNATSPCNITTNDPAAPYGLHGKAEVGRYGVAKPINTPDDASPYGIERPV